MFSEFMRFYSEKTKENIIHDDSNGKPIFSTNILRVVLSPYNTCALETNTLESYCVPSNALRVYLTVL